MFVPIDIKNHLRDELQRARHGSYICPICGSGTGSNATGALSVLDTPTGARWKCFACGSGGDIVDLFAERDGISLAEARAAVLEKYGGIYGHY